MAKARFRGLKKVDQKKLLILDRVEELDCIEDYKERDCSFIYQSHNHELERIYKNLLVDHNSINSQK